MAHLGGLLTQTKHLPYSNSRLVLKSEAEDEDAYFSAATVVRLFHSPTSHPAVCGTIQGLEYT